LNIDPPTASIRPLSPADYDSWLPLWKQYQSFYAVRIPDEVSSQTFSRMLDPAEPMFGALMFRQDKAIGMVHWIHHRSNWSARDYCYLEDLFVSEDSRGRGHGRQLMEYVFSQAQQAGCAGVYWLTQEQNATARLLYDRMVRPSGFIHYQRNFD
jgi:ribosomal protein S18 acetylase RimI-like enzyme